MKILFLGDVVGQRGCEYLREKLPELKRNYKTDVVIANGENASEGNGLLPTTAQHLFDSGVDVLTGGNHSLRRRELTDLLDQQIGVLRPANYHPDAPGVGVYMLDRMRWQLCIINIQGMSYMDPIANPFHCIDRLLEDIKTPNILVDFHAETTSEKLSMGYYLDGRVSAVLGTHTHVQTADERILPNGTAYITDAGMCGGYDSVLGVKPELAIRRFVTGLPTRFENDKGPQALWGVLLDIDQNSGRATQIERVCIH